jgi:hypothetical protein
MTATPELETPTQLGCSSVLDLVYVVRDGDFNDEFRTSLRSVQEHYRDSRITVVGYRPFWLSEDVRFVPGNVMRNKQQNVYRNVQLACEIDDLPDEVVIMNDDFIMLRPHEPALAYRCTLDEHVALNEGGDNSWWSRSLVKTQSWLTSRGFTNLLSYELHRPFPVSRARMSQVLAEAWDGSDNPPQWRTLYGNYWSVQCPRSDDAKLYVRNKSIPDADCVSTTDSSFRLRCGRMLQDRFTAPSRWEA